MIVKLSVRGSVEISGSIQAGTLALRLSSENAKMLGRNTGEQDSNNNEPQWTQEGKCIEAFHTNLHKYL